jgi:hypothetical protein
MQYCIQTVWLWSSRSDLNCLLLSVFNISYLNRNWWPRFRTTWNCVIFYRSKFKSNSERT